MQVGCGGDGVGVWKSMFVHVCGACVFGVSVRCVGVGAPFNVQRVAYLDTNLNWVGDDLLKVFKLGEKIGKGGFSEVYVATHQATGGKFAVKIFNDYSETTKVARNGRTPYQRHASMVSWGTCVIGNMCHGSCVMCDMC